MLRDNGDFRVCQYASTRRFACAPFLAPKSLRQIGYPWFFRTNSESANEPLMGGSFFCGERGGDRSIGGANLRKGRQPPLTAGSSHRHCRPISMETGGFKCVIGGGEWCNIKCLTMLGIRLNCNLMKMKTATALYSAFLASSLFAQTYDTTFTGGSGANYN